MWPVAELHLHLEGTLDANLLITLARRNDIALPSYDPAELTARYDDFANLQAFLDIHYANLAVLRTEQDFYDLASGYLLRAWQGGVRRAEMFFDPQTHVNRGVPFEAVITGFSAAIDDASARTGICADLILCFLRDLGADAAADILRTTLPFRDRFFGVGLDSTEVGFPPSLFEKVYDMAAVEGLHRVAHAGEEAGPDYVWQALDLLHVERIDHGNRALEDPVLVARLVEEQIPLTVCPLSNVYLKTTPSLEQHPLPAMLEAGLLVTINSDDPAYFGGGVEQNFSAIEQILGLDRKQLAKLAGNSFDAAFIHDEDRSRWKAEVEAAAS